MEPNSSTTGDHDRLLMNMDSSRRSFHPRACSDKGVKLFGVRLTHDTSMAMSMRKAVSMGNLSSYNSVHVANVHSPPPTGEHCESGEGPGLADPHGYVSDGLVQNSGSLRERKKGVPWTEDEHRMFLVGLQKLGKGDWRGIARNFVPTRTPTQVASHAQKYFLRQNNLNKRKRRSSLFDIISSNPVSSVCNAPDHVGSCAMELNLVSSTSASADLCLGISDEGRREQLPQVQKQCHKFSSQQPKGVILGTKASPEITKLLPLMLNFSSESSFMDSNPLRPSAVAMSFPSASAMSSSSSSSSLSSLSRIDEASELATSLTLSIGPPLLLEPTSTAELTLKLEQPCPTRHAIAGSTDNSGVYTTAIRVV